MTARRMGLFRGLVNRVLGRTRRRAPPEDNAPVAMLTLLAQRGGSFDWLADEPDRYSVEDGELVP